MSGLIFVGTSALLGVQWRDNIPFGGLLLAVTWGAFHFISQGFEVGIFTIVMSIAYGFVYLSMSKNIRYAYIAIAVMFVL